MSKNQARLLNKELSKVKKQLETIPNLENGNLDPDHECLIGHLIALLNASLIQSASKRFFESKKRK